MRKLLIFTAPSGAGKTTIVRHLLNRFDRLAFSISATTRQRRPSEVEGKDYYFISKERFQELIAKDAFVEWEQVYEDQFYGTLKREVERLWQDKKHIIFDIDVNGALNIKRTYPQQSLAVFIRPPSQEVLIERLKQRRTEDKKSLEKRIKKVKKELLYQDKFDVVLINDDLGKALKEAERLVINFLKQ